jgi:hypothetical protein
MARNRGRPPKRRDGGPGPGRISAPEVNGNSSTPSCAGVGDPAFAQLLLAESRGTLNIEVVWRGRFVPHPSIPALRAASRWLELARTEASDCLCCGSRFDFPDRLPIAIVVAAAHRVLNPTAAVMAGVCAECTRKRSDHALVTALRDLAFPGSRILSIAELHAGGRA